MPDALFPLRKETAARYGTVNSPHVAEEIRLADEQGIPRLGGSAHTGSWAIRLGDALQRAGEQARDMHEAAKPAIAVAGVGLNMALDAITNAARAFHAYVLSRPGPWYRDPPLAGGASALTVFVLYLLFSHPAAPKPKPGEVPVLVRTAVAPAGTRLDFQQLPCWSGSCQNWQLRWAAKVDYAMPDDKCDAFAAAYGCSPCKRFLDVGLAPYGQLGRIALCAKGPERAKEVSVYGTTATAKPFVAPSPQALYLERLPCDSGSCTNNFLFQFDGGALVRRDEVCDYFSRAFGCGACARREKLASDHRLEPYLATGRRVTRCATPPPIGAHKSASGLLFTVREYQAGGGAQASSQRQPPPVAGSAAGGSDGLNTAIDDVMLNDELGGR